MIIFCFGTNTNLLYPQNGMHGPFQCYRDYIFTNIVLQIPFVNQNVPSVILVNKFLLELILSLKAVDVNMFMMMSSIIQPNSMKRSGLQLQN